MDDSTFPPAALLARLEACGVQEADLDEQFIQGGGPGGQKINKTSICVRIFHAPSGIEVRCQDGRSRLHNRLRAREILCERLEEARRRQRLEAARLRAAQRARTRKPSVAAKRRKREEKTRRSETKQRRQKPTD